MVVKEKIEQKIETALSPVFFEVTNESYMHNVPAGSESHFKVVVVSKEFEGLPLIKRHRAINSVLADELKNDIHALAIHTYTESEWHAHNGQAPYSPPCRGGSNLG